MSLSLSLETLEKRGGRLKLPFWKSPPYDDQKIHHIVTSNSCPGYSVWLNYNQSHSVTIPVSIRWSVSQFWHRGGIRVFSVLPPTWQPVLKAQARSAPAEKRLATPTVSAHSSRQVCNTASLSGHTSRWKLLFVIDLSVPSTCSLLHAETQIIPYVQYSRIFFFVNQLMGLALIHIRGGILPALC